MCLVLLAWQQNDRSPLILAANRDEFHARPSAAIQRWADAPKVIGGRDLLAGGTWLGATDNGRFAVVTNVRERPAAAGSRSRGELTADYLRGNQSAADYVGTLFGQPGEAFGGYNLIVGDGREVWYCSNREGAGCHEGRQLAPGIYGLSNRFLDTPWPKLTSSRERFAEKIHGQPDPAEIFSILSDREIVPDESLPATGVPLAWERLLSAVFVCSPEYGTRASTLLTFSGDGMGALLERTFSADGSISGETQMSLGKQPPDA